MRIEAYIKDLLFDFNQVVIPGFGAFVGTEKFAHIHEAEQKIYPPSKQISFDDQLQLDDGVLISKIEEEEQLDKDAAIEAMQHFVEELSTKLDNQKVYTIEGLGTLRKAKNEHIAFQQNKTINYFVDAYGLEPIDLPKRISLNETRNGTENKIVTESPLTDASSVEEKTDIESNIKNDEVDEEEIGRLDDIQEYADSPNNNPHAGQEILDSEEVVTSYESIEEDTVDVEEAHYQLNEQQEHSILENQHENTVEEEQIASGFDEYVEDSNDNYQIEAENVEVTEYNETTKKGFSLWLLLLPLMLLFGAGYLLFSLMGKTENPYADKMPQANTPVTEKVEEKSSNTNSDIQSDKANTKKKEDKGLSANSTAALLQTKAEKAKVKKDTEKKSITSTKENTKNKNQPTSSSTNLTKGYYVIISSTKSKNEASVEAQKWTKRGYPAFVLPGPNNYNRIGIFADVDKTVAEQKLASYKTDIDPAAWILKY